MISIIKSALKKIDKYNRKILDIYLVINVIWIFLGIFFYNYFRFSYQNFSTTMVFLFIINLMIIIYCNVRKKVKFDKIDIYLILLVIFGIIATVFAKNIGMSLYGTWKRYEGLFQILYYYSLFYLSTLSTNKKIISHTIMIFGLVNVFVSFLQKFNVLKFIPINNRNIVLATGLITNSNFFGSYMTLCLGLAIGLFLYEKNNKVKNIIYLLLVLCFYSGLLFSNAMSGVVGLFGICVFIVIYYIYNVIKKQNTKFNTIKHLVLLGSCLLVSIYLTNSNKTIIYNDVKKFSSETIEISKDITENNSLNDDFGSGRIFIWKKTVKNIPKYWLHGVGVDCFLFMEEQPIFTNKNEKITYFDKAHNEYLQKTITEGIFSGLTYLLFLFTIFVTSIQKIFKENKNIIYLFLPFIGYSIQAFFNISVIEVAPLFFIVIGILYERNCKVKTLIK